MGTRNGLILLGSFGAASASAVTPKRCSQTSTEGGAQKLVTNSARKKPNPSMLLPLHR